MSYRIRPDGKLNVLNTAGAHAGLGRKLGDHLVAFALPDELAVST